MYGRIDGWVDGWKDEWNGWMELMHGMDGWNTVITRKDGRRVDDQSGSEISRS